ncbi:MAG: hypothetical protein MI919_09620 [Holophagales bacterium]|nr:hypothetical protein [Holophagales bacterium]
MLGIAGHHLGQPSRLLLSDLVGRDTGVARGILLLGFAFQYRNGSPFWDRRLAGRSALVITTLDTPPGYFR